MPRSIEFYHTEKGAVQSEIFLPLKVLWVFRLKRIDRVPVKYRLDYLRQHEESTNE